MIGKHDKNKSGRCPVCGGRLVPNQQAAIPFILDDTVAVIKDVPASVCASCHEPYTSGAVTDRLVALLQHLASLRTEVSVVSYGTVPLTEELSIPS
jgi:YgiT-type zinc finger domain-containing protein